VCTNSRKSRDTSAISRLFTASTQARLVCFVSLRSASRVLARSSSIWRRVTARSHSLLGLCITASTNFQMPTRMSTFATLSMRCSSW